MNNLSIFGRITSELQAGETQSGTNRLKFSIAYNEKYNGEEKSHFFNCVAFGKQADFIVKYCKKGGRVIVGGKLSQNRWQTNEGQNRSAVEILCREITPIDWKDRDDNSQGEQSVPEMAEQNPFSEDSIPF